MIQVLAPVVRGRKGEYRHVFEEIQKLGFVRVRANGQLYELPDAPKLDRYKQHTIEVVVDRLVICPGVRIAPCRSRGNLPKISEGAGECAYREFAVAGGGTTAGIGARPK